MNTYHNTTFMKLENCLLDLLQEFGLAGLELGYKLEGGTLIIYTRSCGLLIGFHGDNAMKISERLKQEFGYIKKVEYQSITNILPQQKWTDEEIDKELEARLNYFNGEF